VELIANGGVGCGVRPGSSIIEERLNELSAKGDTLERLNLATSSIKAALIRYDDQ
jgi:hypothetical protein